MKHSQLLILQGTVWLAPVTSVERVWWSNLGLAAMCLIVGVICMFAEKRAC